jgi:hypothetical protein
MPLEAIECTGCGSSDVQEVKPSTYFCTHCESVFKHVDPQQLKVEHTPASCSCGDAIQIQCQLCGTGICRRCDVFRPTTDGVVVHPDRLVNVVISAEEWGYPPWSTSGDGFDRWLVQPDPFVRFVRLADDLARPVLPVGVLLRLLSVHGSLAHLCWSCVGKAVPELEERLSSGQMCEKYDCGQPAQGRCRCCGGAFCTRCLGPGPHWTPEAEARARRREVLHIQAGRFGESFPVQHPDNLCAHCRWEQKEGAKQLCFGEYSDVLVQSVLVGKIRDDVFEVPIDSRRRKRAQKAEAERSRAVAERIASELTARLEAAVIASNGHSRTFRRLHNERTTERGMSQQQ